MMLAFVSTVATKTRESHIPLVMPFAIVQMVDTEALEVAPSVAL